MAFLKWSESTSALAKKIRAILVGDQYLQANVPHAANGDPLSSGPGAADPATLRTVTANNDLVLDGLAAVVEAIGDIPGGGGGGGGDVNLDEVGGTAVAVGAGAVNAGTQRVTLPSDDPAVAVLGATGDAAATQGSTGTISAKLRTATSQLNTIAGALKAEDAASAGGDVGVPAMAVQTATPADTAADGDWTWLAVKGGRLYVSGPGAVTCQVSVTRPNDTNAYSANDIFADSTSAPTAGGFTLSNAARLSGGTGVIKSVRVDYSTKPATRPQFLLLLFDAAPTAGNDNAAEGLSDADRQKLIPGGVIPIACTQDFANGCYGQATGLDIVFTCSGSANLRLLILCLNAFTPAAQDVLHVRFGVEYRD